VVKLITIIRTETIESLKTVVFTLVVCSVLYTGSVWLIGRVFMPSKADGSLLRSNNGTVIGSELIAQKFSKPYYFWSRPSGVDYNASSSGASNMSPTNPALKKRVETQIAEQYPKDDSSIPLELVTTSGSGLDPHLSLAAIEYQIPRLAEARGVTKLEIEKLVQTYLQQQNTLIKSKPIVNVLELNLLLDKLYPIEKNN